MNIKMNTDESELAKMKERMSQYLNDNERPVFNDYDEEDEDYEDEEWE